MELQLTLLDGCVLSSKEGHQFRLGTRKSWALLARLAQSRGGDCTRESVAACLWPRSGEEQARASLRQELAALRKILKEGGSPDPFETHQDNLALRSDIVSVDTQELERIALSGDIERIRHIPHIFKGEFAEGLNIRSAPFADWLQSERYRLCDIAISALETVLTYDEKHGEPHISLKTAQAIIALDPSHEAAHRRAMRSLDALGRRADAVMQFNRLEQILRQELNTDPSAETVEVFNRLRQQGGDSAVHRLERSNAVAGGKPEKRLVTIAAFGVSFQTTTGQQLDAEDSSELMETMEALCRDTVPKFGGRFLGRSGDRCLAIFGYPAVGELDAERAVFAATDLHGKGVDTTTGDEVQICCGIASGEALVQIGQADNLTPGHLSGGLITQATTLSFTATGIGVLVCGATLALMRRAFKTSFVPIPGHATGAYRIGSERVAANRFDIGERQNTLSSFTGRDEELKTLATLWHKVLEGGGQAVSIVGEPGIGKSRLVHHFLRNKVVEVATRLNFSGSLHHRNTAFYPLIQELRRVIGFKPSDDRDTQAKVLSSWLADLGRSSEHDLNHLWTLLEPDIRSPEHEADAAGLVGTILGCLLQMAEQAPVILVFEDVHWMDSSSSDLLHALQISIAATRILLVSVTRPVLEPEYSPPETVCQLELSRLSKQQISSLARHIRPSYLTEADTAEVARRSDGIPLFLEELMNGLPLEATAQFAKSPIVPASLQETLMARIDRMGDEKEILHIAAAIGKVFDYALLKVVTDCGETQLQDYLQQLQDQDLVFRIGQIPYARYEFKHALVQELTYISILRSTCKSYHRRIAEALQTEIMATSSIEPELIAWHLEKAGVSDKAIDFLEIAGRQAVGVSAHHEAAQHFRRALDLANRNNASGKYNERIKQFLLLLGPQLLAENGFASAEVKSVYRRAKSLSNICVDKSQNSEILWGLWSNCIVRAELHTAVELAEDFLSLAPETGDPLNKIAGFYARGISSYYKGAFAQAEQDLTTAVAAYEAPFDEEMALRFGVNLRVTANAYLLWIHSLSGNFDRAVRSAASLISETEVCNHDASTGFAHNFISGMHNFMGNHAQAEHHAKVAEVLSDGQGFAQFRAQARINLGRAQDRLCQAQGLEMLRQGLAEYVDTGARLALPYAQAWLAEALLDQGKLTQAQEAISIGLDFSARSGVQYFDAELLRIKAIILDRFGPSPDEEIIDIYEQSLAASNKVGARALHTQASGSLFSFLKRRGYHEAASKIAVETLETNAVTGSAPISENVHEVLSGSS
ncbi:AAA family ATPase [Roseibium marinum]|uniref:Transcriptional activator n=1 Tax=Roseibium marinum TaxID=281252 RepID=A0A2S3UWC4_9HYPH|nr:AAA family ATPase [Roseibium marinum]POF31769.1 transcriptional activator [Roseibium marinum]